MKIIVVGAHGAVGRTAVKALSERHEVVTVGKTSGDVQVDLEDIASIRAVIPPFLMGPSRRIHAAVFSFIAGVMPPMSMLGRSLL